MPAHESNFDIVPLAHHNQRIIHPSATQTCHPSRARITMNDSNKTEYLLLKNDQNADMVKQDESDTEFSAAVKSTMNSRIRNGSDVNFVAIRNGKVRLRP